ncbi:hypothetical protein [Enterobacter cloacae]|uniref:hypothetical protein n=1 Tax=Enterobacter cloacae TaxID=550 RepID=UPI0020751E24|nr:hypothetical protein [Enterobacter cloacae]ELV2841676.1 hypothetical protein [Enterobacter cloacae]MCM7404770.1 hypothetical protein [Enterobacter cloacae]HAS0824992.1 hypothetical protein [Enterobacter cloacae subsp. cloacae]HAS1958474.1 hypothetical protein [Enterobacter cloacae]
MKKLILIASVSLALSGCVMAQPHSHKHHVEEATNEQVASNGVADPLHAIKLVGSDYDDKKGVSLPLNVSIGNGYTKALINDEPAKIIRKNAEFYEIKGNGYWVSVYLTKEGFSSASWNRYINGKLSRIHGNLNLVEGAE